MHCDLRIDCSCTFLILEVDFPTLKFHRVKKFSKILFRNSIIPLWEWIPPVWFNMPLQLWKWGERIGVFIDSLFISLSLFLVVSAASGLNSCEEDAKFFELLKIAENSPSWSKWSFKNVSCNTRTMLSITRQSRIAARQGSGTQNRRGLIGNVGRSRAAPWFRIVNMLLHLTRNLLCSVIPKSEAIIDSRSQDSSLYAWTIHQFLLVLLDLFLRNKFFSILQFLGNLLHGLLAEFQFSIQAYFYLSESDLPIDLLDVTEVVEIQTLAWSLEKRCQKFSSPNFSPQLLPQLHFPFQGFCGDFLCFSTNAQRFDIDLHSLLTVNWK